MTQPKSSIPLRQNQEPSLELLRAMSVAHARVRRLEGLRLTVSTVIAATGLVAAFADRVASVVTALGVLWALAYTAGLSGWTNTETRRAAALQEEFDVRLYGIPWNEALAGDRVNAHDVSRLAKRYRGDEGDLRDYYEIPDLPPPLDVLACQMQNLGWGARVRRRYGQAVIVVLVIWGLAGIGIGVAAELTLSDLLTRWYVPSLGALLLGIEAFRGQRDVVARRERALALVKSRVARLRIPSKSVPGTTATAADDDLVLLARQVQDVLLLTRQGAPRVPDWFFSNYRQDDRADFQATMTELVTAVKENRAG
ncbi:S-4TM family putative pore-forming effector [Actinoallomurus soli]|uniref:S-4TM family putative pore-forming effector n=1 Tax=Actinoallomurus soli TaxID=2952535 RepID=UPI0020920ECD|nr:S-4TM family putative pore-forming effector [Actinoallomurus soli]MCO5967005.1 S-4TM family putative pore-forming effector [Actinoallomurus soli]